MDELRNKLWWGYLEENQRDLLEQAGILLEREEQAEGLFHDYAFIVFPAAKAYEGFLKKLFLDLGLIDQQQYESNHFRIGRALNPDLPQRFRDRDWVWQALTQLCQPGLPAFLWETWKSCRNLLFHWFPKHKNFITLEGAKGGLDLLIEAIDRAFAECKK